MSEWLQLKERVAGVTFLALGNGAADMFAVIAAVRVDAVDLAVGALQGGSMCVTTICTSGVIYAVAKSEINAKGVFFLDLVFNALSCLLIFYILADGRCGVLQASSLLVLYVFYVGLISLVGNGWSELARKTPYMYVKCMG